MSKNPDLDASFLETSLSTLGETFSFLTDTPGITGDIKASPEDFIVEEISQGPEGNPDGNYLIVDLKLTNWETNRAFKHISKKLHISRNRIEFAGTKDKRAITRQLISIQGKDFDIEDLKIVDMEVMGSYRSDRPVKMGDLLGNKFKIRLTRTNPGAYDHAAATLEQIKEAGGFPNYFGPQRFGTIRPITHMVGKHIIRRDYEEAVRTYIANPFPAEGEEACKAREMASDLNNLEEALKIYPHDYSFERSMMHYLISNPGDYVGAINQLPSNLTLMFVHAYQSLLFNRILSERLVRGLPINEPIVGDIILPATREGIPDRDTTVKVSEGNLNKVRKKVKKNKAFVTGLVPGTKEEFASGEMGEIERKVVEEELGDLDLSTFIVPDIPRLTTKGTRREMLSIVKDPVMNSDGDDLVLEFTLNKGNYATCLLREIFKK